MGSEGREMFDLKPEALGKECLQSNWKKIMILK